tara:strand:- start:1370 stop:1924 length:555 start_codon:yes stop_codon:yes gene_type:complete
MFNVIVGGFLLYVIIWVLTNVHVSFLHEVKIVDLYNIQATRKGDKQIFDDLNLNKNTYTHYLLFYLLFFWDYSYNKFSKRVKRDVNYINNFKHNEYNYDKWKTLEHNIKHRGYAPNGKKEYLTISKDNCIIEGHHRAEILKTIGYRQIPVNVVNLHFPTLVLYKHLQYFPILFVVNIINTFKKK